MAVKIIDVSKHNVINDWKKVKASGVDGVIIRAGYGRHISQKDPTFEKYYYAAKAAGLNVGAYWYSYADSPVDAKTEAEVFLTAIKGKQFELPVYFDIEEEKHVAMGKTMCTAIVAAFCDVMEKAGYFCGVYSFDSFFGSNLEKSVQQRYSCWVANVSRKPQFCTAYGMWQYSWAARINGASGDVDISYCYKDFPKIIKAAYKNGYAKKAARYNVTARISGVSAEEADRLALVCKGENMTVVVCEEE